MQYSLFTNWIKHRVQWPYHIFYCQGVITNWGHSMAFKHSFTPIVGTKERKDWRHREREKNHKSLLQSLSSLDLRAYLSCTDSMIELSLQLYLFFFFFILRKNQLYIPTMMHPLRL